MSDAFVPLAVFLRPVVAEPAAELPSPAPPVTAPVCDDYDETLRAARRFRAGLADALEAAVEQLLRSIARDVLARELRLDRADVGAILSSALNRFNGEPVLRVRVHPADRDALAGVELERIADDALQPGDMCIELQSGTIDLRLPARLEAALAAWA